MPLAPPPEIFAPPSAAPVTPALIGPPAAAPGTPPATPAPAAAAPAANAAVFAPAADCATMANYRLRFTGYTSIHGDSQSGNSTYTYFGLDGSGNRVWTATTGTAGDSGLTSRNRIWWSAGYYYVSMRSVLDYALGYDTDPPGIWRAAAASPTTEPETLTYTVVSDAVGSLTMTAVPAPGLNAAIGVPAAAPGAPPATPAPAIAAPAANGAVFAAPAAAPQAPPVITP